MNSKILIPDPALELTIRRITENLAVEEIYAYLFRTQGKLFNQLYVLLRHESGQEIISARALCNVAVSEKAGYDAYVLFPEDVNRQLNQGNIRAALIFHPDNRVYENPSPGTRVVFQEVNYQKRYKKATQYFEKEIAKLHAFEQGYRLYMDSENYSQASFMLHQVLELGFRLAENLIMGKAKMTHSIRKHQEYIRSFSPEMGSLFADDEWNILRKLDESYSSARYDHDFSVSKEDLLWAASKAKELLTYLMAFNQDLLDEIQRRQVASGLINNEPADGNLAIEEGGDTERDDDDGAAANSHKEQILSAIGRQVVPTHVFCFAYQSRKERSVNLVTVDKKAATYHRYYLVILTEETMEHPLQTQHKINEMLGKELEIVALYVRMSTFNKKLEEGLEFFHFLANTSDRWWGEEGQLKVTNTPGPVDLEKRRWQWKRYFWSAEGLMAMVQDQIGSRYDESCSVIMSHAVEQLCLGTLHAIWGYRPDNILNLMYLIQLTESITPLARECFCLDVPEEKEMMVELSKALSEFRYNSAFDANGFTLYILRDRLLTFSKGLEQLVNLHFEKLEAVGR